MAIQLLNSVIIEGVLTNDPKFISSTCKDACAFTINYMRRGKDTETQESVKTYVDFDIETYGKVAISCENHLKKGRNVRIVGRLKKSSGKVVVVGEHVEFKPLY